MTRIHTFSLVLLVGFFLLPCLTSAQEEVQLPTLEIQQIAEIQMSDNTLLDVDWSPDGNRVLVTDATSVYLFNANFELEARYRLASFRASIISTALSPDGRLAASLLDSVYYRVCHPERGLPLVGCLSTLVYIWEVDSGRIVDIWRLDDFAGIIAAPHDWSPDGAKIAVGDINGTIAIYDVIHQQQLATFSLPSFVSIYSVSWHPDSSKLAIGGLMLSNHFLDAALVLDTTTGEQTDQFIMVDGLRVLDWSPDGRLLALSSDLYMPERLDNPWWLRLLEMWFTGVYFWQPGTNRQINSMIFWEDNWEEGLGPAVALSWHPDGRFIACHHNRDQITIWDAKTGLMVARFSGGRRTLDTLPPMRPLAWNADGTRLAEADLYGVLRVWSFNKVAGE